MQCITSLPPIIYIAIYVILLFSFSSFVTYMYMSLVRKHYAYPISADKSAILHSVCYQDSMMSLVSIAGISNILIVHVVVQVSLSQTWTENPKAGFWC